MQGFRGRRKNCYSLAVRSVHKALQYQYISRRLKKRDMRKVRYIKVSFHLLIITQIVSAESVIAIVIIFYG